MTQDKNIYKDKPFIIGLTMIIVSYIIYLFLQFSHGNRGLGFMNEDGIYFINFAIALVFSCIILARRIIKKKTKYRYIVVILVLFSISCFSLNISLPVFANFSNWVDICLLMMHLALIATCFDYKMPKVFRSIIFFILGLGSILTLYFAIHLTPLMPVAVIGVIFFGLSLHLFVPLALFIIILVHFFKRADTKYEKIAFYLGVILPLIVASLFISKWNSTRQMIHTANATIVTRPDNNLPKWVLLSQELEDDFFTERILKSGIQFETKMFGDINSLGSRNSINEIIEHDPLVTLGSELMGAINISVEDRKKIIASKYDLRHHLKRKLWSGSNLSTSSVISNTKVFPDYRLAYTEKIITIKNNYNRGRGNRQEEALFTFHLPEGSVATSLSLWIEGKEEKSRLTTKSKADSAYTSIVGVERRDPSLMHWQEGNTITVYVFPCTPKEERMFKVGITSPLKNDGKNLTLQNIYFEGPESSDALETSIIEFISDHKVNATVPKYFDGTAPYNYIYTGNYKSYFEASCKITPLSNKSFSFNGKSYRMAETIDKNVSCVIENLYLDINKSWTSSQFESILKDHSDKNIYVYHDKLKQINDKNKYKLFSSLKAKNFSLFPFHEIGDLENSLVISSSTSISPSLIDLKNSKFINELKGFLSERKGRINLYNLGEELSPYLKTLKEFQIFDYVDGDEIKLNDLISSKTYPNDAKDDNHVDLDLADVTIIRDTTSSTSNAPDHLMRLFSYNKIMQECGRNYFTESDYIEEELIDAANEAFIVSPISSLIVLETIKDYDRFDIGENKNSLNNATTSSSGAVPEPHEWALIILLCSTLIFMSYKKRQSALTVQ